MAAIEDSKVFISETSVGRLYVYVDEHKSQRYLHIRYWYHDKKTDTWKPGVKGIAIPEGNIKKVFDAVAQALKMHFGKEGKGE